MISVSREPENARLPDDSTADVVGEPDAAAPVEFPRLEPPAAVDDEMAEFLATTKLAVAGRALKLHQVLAHHPRAGIALNGFLEWGPDAVLSTRDRRLIILRTAANAACSYELGIHRWLGIATGDVTPDEVEELVVVGGSIGGRLWSDRERVLVNVTDAVCHRDTLDDDQWSAASAELSEAVLIECLMVSGFYRMCAILANALGVPDEDPSRLGVSVEFGSHCG